MSYRKQKKLSLLPTRSDGLASFLLISFHRCCPLSFGEAHFCRRRRSQKAITSDQRGFAGVRPTATHAPPANMRSPVLRSPAQSVFRRAGRSSELTISSGEGVPCRRKSPKKVITSDHGGFAGVRPPHHAASSGEHSLTGVELAGAVCLPTSGALVGADDFLRLRFFRLFFLDYFDATGHYNGTINYKLTGSTHKIPKMRSKSGSPHGSAEGFLQTKESTGAMRLCLRA